MMRIVIKPKRGGKTDEAIRLSAEKWFLIVCDNDGVQRVSDRAIELGLEIPYPITYSEFIAHSFYGAGLKGFILDNIEMLLLYLAKGVPIGMISLTGPENDFEGDEY
jgi:hypothetical protein